MEIKKEQELDIGLDFDRPRIGSIKCQSVEDLSSVVKKHNPAADLNLIQRAYKFAETAHGDNKRLSGEPYITHPLAVASYLAELPLDSSSISAGLLHDTIEDTSIKKQDIEKEFGKEIAELVDGVTNVGLIDLHDRDQKQLDNIRRMLLATGKDLRVIIIKLCDCLHNMRTLAPLPDDRKIEISKTAINIYAPLAHRMGIGKIKWELEDIAFSYLNPQAYKDIKERVNEKVDQRKKFALEVCQLLKQKLLEFGLTATVAGRAKHFYSIYRKMLKYNCGFDEIYDLTAIRILLNTVEECYTALGIVHSLWIPVDGRFRDYISAPKQNDYRSLHTTVLGPRGKLVEIQIRNFEMHRVAEEGVAAHWRYKEKKDSNQKLGKDAKWIQQLSSWLEETRNPEELAEYLRTDLFADEIFIYTPKGDIVNLPSGSTPVDFAYKIHTDLGEHCAGAKVSGKFVSLNYPLKTGDVIEIVSSPKAQPSQSWLKFAKTARAKTKIKKFLKESKRDELISFGKNMLSKELSRLRKSPSQILASDELDRIANSLDCSNKDDLFLNLGFGHVTLNRVIARLFPKTTQQTTKTQQSPNVEKLKVNDIDGVVYRRALCCSPVPGEPIVGIVTKGRGISIHRSECSSVLKYKGNVNKRIPLKWDVSDGETYLVEISVNALDRTRLLADLSNIISLTGTNIASSQSKLTAKDTAQLCFAVEVANRTHLDNIINRLIAVPGVKSVIRRRPKTS